MIGRLFYLPRGYLLEYVCDTDRCGVFLYLFCWQLFDEEAGCRHGKVRLGKWRRAGGDDVVVARPR